MHRIEIANAALRRSVLPLACITLAALAAPRLQAQAGQLDPSFGTGGVFSTSLTIPDNNSANVLALQPDGKILVAGSMNNQGALLRLNADGTPDAGFGTAGIVISNFQLVHAPTVTGLALQPDGKILAAATTVDVFPAPRLARFNANGTLDTSFGSNGFLTLPVHSVNALLRLDDGRILIAGGPGVLAPLPGTMTRLLPDGQLDLSFGSNGLALLVSPSVTALALQPDGHILISSGAPPAGTLAPAPGAGSLTRYTADGAPDPNFGIAGQAACIASASALAVQPDGRILLAGSLTSALLPAGNDTGFGVVRFSKNGILDLSFGTRGGAIASFAQTGPLASASALLVTPSGDILAAGQAGQVPAFNEIAPSSFALARIRHSGKLDGSFGTGGEATTSFGQKMAYVSAAALQADGELVVAGNSASNTPQGILTNFSIARYLTQ